MSLFRYRGAKSYLAFLKSPFIIDFLKLVLDVDGSVLRQAGKGGDEAEKEEPVLHAQIMVSPTC